MAVSRVGILSCYVLYFCFKYIIQQSHSSIISYMSLNKIKYTQINCYFIKIKRFIRIDHRLNLYLSNILRKEYKYKIITIQINQTEKRHSARNKKKK